MFFHVFCILWARTYLKGRLGTFQAFAAALFWLGVPGLLGTGGFGGLKTTARKSSEAHSLAHSFSGWWFQMVSNHLKNTIVKICQFYTIKKVLNHQPVFEES